MINKKRGILLFSIFLVLIILNYFYFQNRHVLNNIEDDERNMANI